MIKKIHFSEVKSTEIVCILLALAILYVGGAQYAFWKLGSVFATLLMMSALAILYFWNSYHTIEVAVFISSIALGMAFPHFWVLVAILFIQGLSFIFRSRSDWNCQNGMGSLKSKILLPSNIEKMKSKKIIILGSIVMVCYWLTPNYVAPEGSLAIGMCWLYFGKKFMKNEGANETFR